VTERIAVVTGGGSGIGAAGATALARDGWRVVIVGRREQALAELAATYPDLPLDPIAADVTAEESVRALFAEVAARHQRLDLLFNNAGMARRGRCTRSRWLSGRRSSTST
jgi:NAD(P)-dependent dehydrogenase (short-subunit alcohol dehydrogenase family)